VLDRPRATFEKPPSIRRDERNFVTHSVALWWTLIRRVQIPAEQVTQHPFASGPGVGQRSGFVAIEQRCLRALEQFSAKKRRTVFQSRLARLVWAREQSAQQFERRR